MIISSLFRPYTFLYTEKTLHDLFTRLERILCSFVQMIAYCGASVLETMDACIKTLTDALDFFLQDTASELGNDSPRNSFGVPSKEY